MIKETIKRFNVDCEFFTIEGCHILELSNARDDSEVSIARVRVEPGVTTRWHRLVGIAERYVILEGKGNIEIGSLSSREVAAGDVILIPPMSPQRISNAGSADLTFLAVCSPRFLESAYEDLETLD